MTRRMTTLLAAALLMVLLSATLAFSSARSDRSASYKQALNYAFTNDGDPVAKNTTQTSLGTHDADGGSPGYIVGRTCQDRQNWYNPGRTVEWRHNPQIHFAFGAQPFGGDDLQVSANWTEYTMFDPTIPDNGVWRSPVMIHTDPFGYTGRMHYVDVDETGHIVVSVYTATPGIEDDPNNVDTYWDVAGAGAYGTFIGDTVPQSISFDPTETVGYPKMEYQEYNGVYTTHIAAIQWPIPRTLSYWRRVGGNPTQQGWEYRLISDSLSEMGEYAISSSRGDGPSGNKVAIAWLQNQSQGVVDDENDNIVFIESTDGGATWPAMGTEQSLINIDYSPEAVNYMPWVEVIALYDSDGYLHIAYNAGETIDGASQGIDPARIYHWTNRVSGPNAGGSLSLVHIADFQGLAPMCARAGTNVTNAANVSMGECNNRLYMTWSQLGDPDVGDSLDCPVDALWDGEYNGDIYMSISLSLDGALWDRGRNLTNSKTPDCDSSVANSCDADNYASLSRHGMDVSSMGTTYWSAVPEAFEVRDYLDATYPVDGHYLDVQYINDLYPEAAPWMDEPIWTYSPMKWFRLPCVDPVIEPVISSPQDDYLAPADWVKIGEEAVIEDAVVANIGNAALSISSITADVTTGQAGWIVISNVPTVIPAAGEGNYDVTINPSGVVTTQEAVVADIIITSDDGNNPILTAFTINTVIADTVVQVIWDTVRTSTGFALTVANQGGAGHSGEEQANMDFRYLDGSGPECDSAQTVYLYDLSSVIMYDGSGDPGTYSWSPFWLPSRSDAHNFFPVPDGVQAERTDQSAYQQYRTNTFVTSDSALGCTKTWVAPTADVTYILEKWEIYSYSGATVTGVRTGEWIDWDIPSGTDGNEGAAVTAEAGGVDYVYQTGQVDPAADPAPCLSEDRRFGATGLLGHYFISERDTDPEANHTGLFGGFVSMDEDLFEDGTDQFIVDSMWAWLGREVMTANNAADEDQQLLLSFGSFDITPGDTLCIWTVHASIYDGDTDDLQGVIDDAAAFYYDRFVKSGCCGAYSDGVYPTGYTGNTNCSDDGKRTLSDITKLIDFVYISKEPMCCYAAGNTNGSWDDGDCKITLSDITKLIDAVYISKELPAECVAGCER